MKKNPSSQSGLFNPRVFVAFTVCSIGALLAMVSFAAPRPRPAPPTFGHPIISGIGAVGLVPSLPVGPSNADPLEPRGPGPPSSATSLLWQSCDGGQHFH